MFPDCGPPTSPRAEGAGPLNPPGRRRRAGDDISGRARGSMGAGGRARGGSARAGGGGGRAGGPRGGRRRRRGPRARARPGPSGAERGGGGGGWAGRGWRAGRLRESSGIRPGGPPPPAAAPRAAARHPRLPCRVNIGGPGSRGGAQTQGETGTPPPLCFCARGKGGEGRADTRTFVRTRERGRGPVRAPPARPCEDKGAAGAEEEEEGGDCYFAGLPGGGPPLSPARLPLTQLDP